MTVAEYLQFRARLMRHEGFRDREYLDTVGKRTIGYGYNVDDRGTAEFERVTGRAYDGSVTLAEGVLLLEHVVAVTERELLDKLPWLRAWLHRAEGVRYGVLLDMAYNLGVPKLLKFKSTLSNIEYGFYADAARAMLQSKWARQVKSRAERLATHMRDGV